MSESRQGSSPSWREETVTVAGKGPATGPGGGDGPSPYEKGQTLGRFEVIDEVGRGGMGFVYRARDPELDREVAIKVLRPGLLAEGRGRIVREAQALAQLNHPNVVAIYDVGQQGSNESGALEERPLFIAMEFVGGQTLREWMGEKKTWSEALAAFVQAGRGLAAAHAAGIVHRDFKPANVLMGEDGRARVTDFGLARGLSTPSQGADPSEGSAPSHVSTSALGEALTRDGALLGTPVYMAPEQNRAQVVDARSDQYAFCTALYEALYGRRPFSATSLHKLFVAKARGILDPPKGSSVPVWLRRVVARGLAVDPGERWPSMVELLDALERRRSFGWRSVAALGAVGVGSSLWLLLGPEPAAECEGEGEGRIAEVWDDARRLAVREALLSTEVSFAEGTWSRVESGFDGFSAAWVGVHREVCDAIQDPDGSGGDPDLQMLCLDRLLDEFEATIDVFSGSLDLRSLERVTEVVGRMPDPQQCVEPGGRGVALGLPGKDEVEIVRAIRAEVLQAEAMRRIGRYEEARRVLEAQRLRARETRYEPLWAEVDRRLGLVLVDLEEFERGLEMLESGYHTALADGADPIAAATATDLLLATTKAALFDDARRWEEHARALVERVGAPELTARHEAHVANLEGQLGDFESAAAGFERALELHRRRADGASSIGVAAALTNLGTVLRSQGRFEEAQSHLESALEIRTRLHGEHHPETAKIHDQLGVVLRHQGKFEESRGHFKRAIAVMEEARGPQSSSITIMLNNYALLLGAVGEYDEAAVHARRALEIEEQRLGEEHPLIAALQANLALTLRDQGKLEEAAEAMRKSLWIRERVYGPGHPDIASAHSNLALFLDELGHAPEAKPHFQAALRIWEQSLGPQHPKVAIVLNNYGTMLLREGDLDGARTAQERALAIREASGGPDHPDVATSLKNLADIQREEGKFAEARVKYLRALQIRETALGPHHQRVASTLVALAEAELSLGNPAEAVKVLERAVSVDASLERQQPKKTATIRFALARALWATGGDRERAVSLARQARTGFVEAGPSGQAKRAEVDQWLSKAR